MPAFNRIWTSAYHDSVTLMRLARDIEAVPGVRRAAAMMGTPQNRALLAEAGLLAPEGDKATPNDLVIAVVADDASALDAAENAARAALSARPAGAPGGGAKARPRTLDSALRLMPDATLALISVPGAYAAAEAMKALRAGLHVMLFSDNVPLDAEIALKRFALERGLFLMGPDCGTAILDGVPLGFANAVARGRIGIAAASGTGVQEVACLIAREGEGLSHAIGVGGRDLSDQVGGLMMERALEALAADPATAVICVIGKPPGPAVARRLAARVRALGKPCVAHFMGEAADAGAGAWHRAATLEDAALAVVALARGQTPRAREFTAPAGEIEALVEGAARRLAASQRFVRGVYAGGTLAYEAIGILSASLEDVGHAVTGAGAGHRVVDLGEDRFTVGRPHPMIDGSVRREWIEREAADPSTAVLLLDVVLGYGAHPDPVAEIAPALARAHAGADAAGRGLAVVASVCGTDADLQNRAGQVDALTALGALVMPSNAQAARLAALIATWAVRAVR
ncbi:MAG: acyl-CoA synthetase FdrA [Candidatus Rokubacteria bacterium]|nr:acyl-CoA synthetase FdrA [Candidatus Rokubacteria bacterium]